MTVERCQVEGRPAPVVRVDVDAVLEQCADGVGLPVSVKNRTNFEMRCQKQTTSSSKRLVPGSVSNARTRNHHATYDKFF